MQYLCIVYLDGSQLAALSPEEQKLLDQQSVAYDHDLGGRGKYITSRALQSPDQAVTVRKRGSDIKTTDGPFIESKEHLGGFILIEARDLNEAIAIAADIPVGKFGAIEVRPIYDQM